jgi:DNA-directed RNA polymerase specialized sigma24 family protein
MADEEGFEAWYARVHPRLVSTVVAVTGDADVAVDAVDEALVRALERWPRVREMTSPDAWTLTVALNVARRRFRRRSMERSIAATGAGPRVLPGPAGELWQVVAGLPLRQRTAVALRHVGGLTEAEIAVVMGVRRGTVSATLRAAYARLREAIDDDEPVEAS